MTDTEKLDLQFYKNGSAEAVLKRFAFSEKEEKLIRDAIRTANRAKPIMLLIRQADALLKEVAETRKPIKGVVEDIDPEELAKSIAKVTAPEPSKKFLSWFRWWYILVLLAFIPFLRQIYFEKYEYDYGNKYTYEEAKTYCKAQGKSLPFSILEIRRTGTQIDTNNIWIKNTDLIKGAGSSSQTDNYKKHVVCVDTNRGVKINY